MAANLVKTVLYLLLYGSVASAQSYRFSSFALPSETSSSKLIDSVVGIDNAGEILMNRIDQSGITHSVVRSADGSTFTPIEASGAASTTASGISAAGLIVGYYSNPDRSSHNFILSADRKTFTIFDSSGSPVAINDKGEVLVSVPEGTLFSGLLRSADGSTYLKIEAPDVSTTVRAINNSGEIAGWVKGGGSYSASHGFTRSADGTYHILDLPGTVQGTVLTAVNNHGQLLGSGPNGFVLNPDGSSVGFDPLQLPGGINDSGIVAGILLTPAGSYGFLAVPTGDTQPAIRSFRGVESASAFGALTAIAPGTWVEIYGANLASQTRQWNAGDFAGDTSPTSLDGVKVTINGRSAFISYVSPGQITAQAPSDLTPGAAVVTVNSGTGSSSPYNTTVAAVEPGLLSAPANEVSEHILIFRPDGSAAQTVKPGDTVVMYGIGFGPTTPDVPAGQIATELDQVQGLFEVMFGAHDLVTGRVASSSGQVTYAGHVPGTVGMYQFNVIVPKQWSQPYEVVVYCSFNGNDLPSPDLVGLLSVSPSTLSIPD